MLAMSVWEQVLHGRLQQETVPQSKKMISTHAGAMVRTAAKTDMSKTVAVAAQEEIVRDQV